MFFSQHPKIQQVACWFSPKIWELPWLSGALPGVAALLPAPAAPRRPAPGAPGPPRGSADASADATAAGAAGAAPGRVGLVLLGGLRGGKLAMDQYL